MKSNLIGGIFLFLSFIFMLIVGIDTGSTYAFIASFFNLAACIFALRDHFKNKK